MNKILVLCTSNSARSQLAEGYLNFYTGDDCAIYSAGITCKGLNPYTVIVMAEDNLDITSQMSKAYAELQDVAFDYLITVCEEAKKNLPTVLKYKKHIHMPFSDPDAIKGGPIEKIDFFRKIRDQIKKGVIKFVGEHLKTGVPQKEAA